MQDAIVLIDGRTVERECLSYLLGSIGYQTVTFATCRDWKKESGADPACAAIIFNDTAADHVTEEVLELLGTPDSGPILVMSPINSLEFAVEVIRRGARGYIPTCSSVNDIIGAISLVRAGGIYMPAHCVLSAETIKSTHVEVAAATASFTPKQAKIIEAVRLGKPNKLIAYDLNMCESTVKVHIRNVMKKLNARNRTELVFKAVNYRVT